jgi:hypothetical protein
MTALIKGSAGIPPRACAIATTVPVVCAVTWMPSRSRVAFGSHAAHVAAKRGRKRVVLPYGESPSGGSPFLCLGRAYGPFLHARYAYVCC